jgi:hypothetical protein
MNLKFLSSGGSGTVLINDHRAFKYGLKKNLIKEFDFMNKIPKLKCFYVHTFVSLIEVSEEKIVEMIDKQFNLSPLLMNSLNKNAEFAMIEMDYIPLRNLSNLLKDYKLFNKNLISLTLQKYDNLKVIEEELFVNLIKSLNNLYNDVKLLNDTHGLYHNDITEFNVMCDESCKDLYLIDFGMSSNTNFDCFNDLTNITELIKITINLGLSNEAIYKKITNFIHLDELMCLFDVEYEDWCKLIEMVIK